MALYSFKIKKDKYQLDLLTTDKTFLVEQFELWVKKASEYAKKKKANECKELVNSQIKAEAEITQKNIDNHLSKHPVAEMPKLNDEPKASENIDVEKKDSNENLDIFYSPSSQKSLSNIIDKSSMELNNNGVFDNILENSLNNPKSELTFKSSPSIKKDNAFLNYINSRKIERKIDYLLLTAYYFTQYEQKPRFTLKQLNAKLMQNIAVILDHGILQEAINRDYIECLPDLTGLVGASEYRLTAYGEKVLLDE
ncbi:hypothetical protein J6R97_00510 [bacterium]|nr:hypothetical protein [bacterium]